MTKKGFTMIELIFVIVILGILAAVAIPRFLATRDDAKIASLAQQIQSAAEEIAAYPVTQGGPTRLDEMSQTLNEMLHQNKAKDTNTSFTGWSHAFSTHSLGLGRISSVTVGAKSISNDMEDCFQFEVNATVFSLRHNPNATGTVCLGVKNIIEDANYTIGGKMLVF